MRLLCLASVLIVGCSPPQNNGTYDFPQDAAAPTPDAPSRPNPPQTTPAAVLGRVWAPGQAPGLVPPGEEIAVFDALVQLTVDRLPPIPQSAFCEECTAPVGVHAVTDHEGTFIIPEIFPGTYWLSIQKAQFRREFQITLAPGQAVALSADETTLPSTHDPDGGLWIPRVALAIGSFDHMEDILAKMGLGLINGAGAFIPGTETANVDIYSNSTSYSGPTEGSIADLVADLDRMLQYHILFIPCSGSTFTSALDDQQNLRNIRDYVAAGGKLYVTDWSGEWSDNVFPAQITLGPGEDTPADAYDPQTDTWNSSLFGDADGSSYDSNNAEIEDPDMLAWMAPQMGPLVDMYSGTYEYDPTHFTVEGNFNVINATTEVEVGVDEEGLPIVDVPQSYIAGGQQSSTPKKPLTVTFEPAGCGRVLYSTYHTTDVRHLGLVPQERVLLYLMMEIGVCQVMQPPIE